MSKYIGLSAEQGRQLDKCMDIAGKIGRLYVNYFRGLISDTERCREIFREVSRRKQADYAVCIASWIMCAHIKASAPQEVLQQCLNVGEQYFRSVCGL